MATMFSLCPLGARAARTSRRSPCQPGTWRTRASWRLRTRRTSSSSPGSMWPAPPPPADLSMPPRAACGGVLLCGQSGGAACAKRHTALPRFGNWFGKSPGGWQGRARISLECAVPACCARADGLRAAHPPTLRPLRAPSDGAAAAAAAAGGGGAPACLDVQQPRVQLGPATLSRSFLPGSLRFGFGAHVHAPMVGGWSACCICIAYAIYVLCYATRHRGVHSTYVAYAMHVCVWCTGRHPPRQGHFGSAHDVAVRRHHDMDICMCVNIDR